MIVHSSRLLIAMIALAQALAIPAPPAAAATAGEIPPAAAAALQPGAVPPEWTGHDGAVRIYRYRAGALYPLVTAVERVTDVALEPGETLISVAAGDTARWNVGDTTSGAGDTLRTHLMIKPQAPDLRTNLVITTDRRVYHLALESRASAAMVAVRWRYPGESPVVLRREAAAAPARAPRGADLTELDFRYTIAGDDPPWRPVRAFDDGRRVYIAFPADLDKGTAPPLFVLGPEGRAQLVNYRVRGHHYIVDRLFDAAELRHGEKTQQIVRICRAAARFCKASRR